MLVNVRAQKKALQLCRGCLRRDLRSFTLHWPDCWVKLPAQRSLTHGLLAHSTLVCVSGWLVVMGVGNKASTHPEQCKGLNLQVCCVSMEIQKNKKRESVNRCVDWHKQTRTLFHVCWITCHSLVDHVFIKGDLTVILLIDIQILHQALVQKILKCPGV